MLTPRLTVLIVLAVVPILLYVGFGTYAVWKTGLLVWLWWILPVCWLLTWLVAWLWKPARTPDAEQPDAGHWTPRDRDAGEIVLRYQQQVDRLSPAQLTDSHFYLNQLQELSSELATHYHPSAADPFSSLTLPELAAAIRLVADDLEKLALHSLPGSRLLTVQQWKSLRDAPKWATRIRNSVWLGSILINPLNIARYGASRATIDRVSSGIQSELLQAIYLRFIRQSGFYLIEMNSGRLRGGADAYRAAFEQREGAGESLPGSTLPGATPTVQSKSLTIGLIGQVSSGKSSLINCMTGTANAAVDILPETRNVQRHALRLPDAETETEAESEHSVTLLDSPGYAEAGASNQQVREIETAMAESDVVLLVLDAHSPARSADTATIQKLSERYATNPQLKPPPVIAVLTHIDLLSPAMEWSPPYDLANPAGPKETSIAQAMDYAREVFGEAIVDVVAVCAAEDADRRWGIAPNLMPAVLAQLGEGKSVALLEAFEKFLDKGQARELLNQLAVAGKQIAKTWLQERLNRMTRQ